VSDTKQLFKPEDRGFDFGTAVAEAGRCLLCHDAPCSQGCPAGTDPGTFIRKLRLRNVTGAIRTVKENNILGGACGVLCPVARLCEKECAACGIDRPIRIGKLQRFLVEQSWRTDFRVFAGRPRPAGEKRVAVIGAGPAGLSCAAELAKLGIPVTVFEARPEAGGVLRYGVPEFRLPKAFLEGEIADVRSLGVEFRFGKRIPSRAAAEALLGKGFSAVFLGIGLWKASRLEGKPRDVAGLLSSVDFLAALRDGRKVAVGRAVKGRTVAVIGGGSVAIDCARCALRLGAQDVYLLYRRSYAQMPAEEDERQEALLEGVHFLLLNQPVGYLTDPRGGLRGVSLRRTRLGVKDASGRRRPEELTGSDWALEAQVAVEAIGNEPEDGLGLIRADARDCRTAKAGVFAGGDIVRGPDLVVRAVLDGKTAARSIARFLTRGRSPQKAAR